MQNVEKSATSIQIAFEGPHRESNAVKKESKKKVKGPECVRQVVCNVVVVNSTAVIHRDCTQHQSVS